MKLLILYKIFSIDLLDLTLNYRNLRLKNLNTNNKKLDLNITKLKFLKKLIFFIIK